jgi:hypothetical protein
MAGSGADEVCHRLAQPDPPRVCCLQELAELRRQKASMKMGELACDLQPRACQQHQLGFCFEFQTGKIQGRCLGTRGGTRMATIEYQ